MSLPEFKNADTGHQCVCGVCGAVMSNLNTALSEWEELSSIKEENATMSIFYRLVNKGTEE